MVGGIVLAGGRSSRMGEPKASLEWHGSTLLRRIAGVVERSVDGPIVVVCSAGQDLPGLPDRYEVVEDAHDGRGPLEGLAAGLRALGGRAELAYVSSTDVPFLHSSFVGAVVGGIGARDQICVPVIGRGWQPLAAAYRTSLTAVLDELLDADERRVRALFDRCRVTRLDREALLGSRGVARGDPDLESVVNLNDPASYAAARARPAPAISVRWGRLGDGQSRADGHASTVRAATLGAVAEVLEIELDGVGTSVNGVATSVDRELPLQLGDAVVFHQE
ncbi:MAG TPA: molybdenum cofactor guanylyltransferase [Solirubrobacteraceae bacterium]